ncbi:hypothetical protein [Enterococcus sp. AZ163]|uniref:hypothetical protein n=1 Tax=Enterococcus sp. AZ163 TaxID=2774638 RepID=UPI003D2E7F69
MIDEKKSAVNELLEKISATTTYIISLLLTITVALIVSAFIGFGESSFYILACLTVYGWISAICHFKKIGVSFDWKKKTK